MSDPIYSSTDDPRAREHLIDALSGDLVGPYAEDEILRMAPYRWYLNGFLAPRPHQEELVLTSPDDALSSALEPRPDMEDMELLGGGNVDGDDEPEDEAQAKRTSFFASSLGMTFLIPDQPGNVATVRVSWGNYIPWRTNKAGEMLSCLARIGGVDEAHVPNPSLMRQPNDVREHIEQEIDEEEENSSRGPVFWQREGQQETLEGISLEIADGAQEILIPNSGGLRIYVRVAATQTRLDEGAEKLRAVSVFLVNEREEVVANNLEAVNFIFQVQMSVETSIAPVQRANLRDQSADAEDGQIADLHYRDVESYAFGHNISVCHERKDERIELRTTWLPRAQAGFVTAKNLQDVTVDMKELSQCDTSNKIEAALRHLPLEYAKWIQERNAADYGSPQRNSTRDTLMSRADRAMKRIQSGIDLLKSNPTIRRAFCLTNLAMYQSGVNRQRFQRDPSNPSTGELKAQWRLFQLAFLLMNITPTLRQDTKEERELRETVDLLYFPTGGGKTEAYFGVAAFTMVLRRMLGRDRADKGYGTTIILRYTLRLLTLDQLERAAMLICALDDVRRTHIEDLGERPYRIGLWVGQSTTPNTVKDADALVNKAKSRSGDRHPFPLKNCPGCGHEIDAASTYKETLICGDERISVYCSNRYCHYAPVNAGKEKQNFGIPVEFIDETIYRFAPEFIIGTVDKFAMVPWREHAGLLFGRARAMDSTDGAFLNQNETNRFKGPVVRLDNLLKPPELIIQDEVHLLTGPLGSLVGLYEFMIEELCIDRNYKDGTPKLPRIVASTATVRRASHQLGRLFGREVVDIFPPHGTEADDSFFAVPDTTRPAREYVGVAASGVSMKKVLRRVYTTLASAAQYNEDVNDFPNSDSYMSLVGYFNSLRELGGARMLVDDEVSTAVRQSEKRKPVYDEDPHRFFRRRFLKSDTQELTSRVSTVDIAKTRNRLDLHNQEKNAIDVVLASNMISVGIDISRLGLMVVSGQPKSTSEYIQATSRVGRKFPGLVVTCFNLGWARDRAQYEDFVRFHSEFYRHVEATSVTPFSKTALDRGLAAMIVGIYRHYNEKYADGRDVMRVFQELAHINDDLVARMQARVDQHQSDLQLSRELKQKWNQFVDDAIQVIGDVQSGGGELMYGTLDGGRNSRGLLFSNDPLAKEGNPGEFPAPMSMRDVESTCPVWVDGHPATNRRGRA